MTALTSPELSPPTSRQPDDAQVILTQSRRPFSPFGRYSNAFLWLLIAATVTHACIFFYGFFSGKRQEDFKAYYFRPLVWKQGGDPYDPKVYFSPDNIRVGGKYLYPPMTLHANGLWSQLFSFSTGYYVFFALKCLALAALLHIWWWHFNFAKIDGRIWFVVCYWVFGRCLGDDLDAGNIVIFEQLGVWTALLFFMKRKWVPFCAIIGLISVCKLTPIVLLGLCFMQREKKAWFAAMVTAAIFTIVLFAPALNPPTMLKDFFALASSRDERGSVNPSALAVMRDLADKIFQRKLGGSWTGVGTLFYASFCILTAALGVRVLRRNRWNLPLFSTIVLGIFLYSLCAPRFKDYAYIIMFVPAISVVWTYFRSDLARLGVLLMMCVHFYRYQQWTVIAALFTVMVWSYLKGSRNSLAPTLENSLQ